jgi:bifunctional DNA-binding transcriptional regulator/antitoxin component of YhaV-PrlF toxin-antitoxin module
MTTKLLKVIGKGQITIPLEWRALLGFQENGVKATLQGNKIIIETISAKEKKWNTEIISLNTLSKEDRELVLKGRKAYKKGEKNKFYTASEFFKAD